MGLGNAHTFSSVSFARTAPVTARRDFLYFMLLSLMVLDYVLCHYMDMKSLLDCTESLVVFGFGEPHREFPLLIIFLW